jgi:hypothetical protein
MATAPQKQSRREDGKIQRNDVSVSPGPGGANPLYTLTIKRDGVLLGEVTQRFGPYRDLYTKLNSDKSCEKLVLAPFPETLARSFVGLSEQQLKERREKLDAV